jgi:hypothetical protein
LINFNKIDDETIKEHGYVLISIDEVDSIPSTLNLIIIIFFDMEELTMFIIPKWRCSRECINMCCIGFQYTSTSNLKYNVMGFWSF